MDVDVRVIAASGDVLDEIEPTLVVIPAGTSFYLGSNNDNALGNERIRRLAVSITVGSSSPKHYDTPSISHVRIDRARQLITAVMTNPFNQSLSAYDLQAYAVVYNRQGKVVGGCDLGTIGNPLTGQTTIKPGAQEPIGFDFPVGVPPSRVAAARVSIDGA